MRSLFLKLYEMLCAGQPFVLVSVVASSGSTPRGDGAKMAVFADGSAMGTIGGGQVEFLSTKLALEALKGKRSITKGFNLTRNQTADIGMICGGQVVVCFQYIDGTDAGFRKLLEYISERYAQDTDAWLVTAIEDEAARWTGVYDDVSGLVLFDGQERRHDHCEHTLLTPEAAARLSQCLLGRAVLSQGTPSFYVEPFIRSGQTYVFGGGHVAQELVPVIAHLDFKTVVYEDREAFSDNTLFGGVHHTVLGDFAKLSEHITIGPRDFAVIMTRGHQSDYTVLEQVLRTPAAYIGVIGSRNKVALTRKRLLEAGFTEKDLERIHAPIGIDIKSETPAEIAISIAAELIRCRAELRGGK